MDAKTSWAKTNVLNPIWIWSRDEALVLQSMLFMFISFTVSVSLSQRFAPQHGHQAGNGEQHSECRACYEADARPQVDDLLGMQNANLLNLPENYTFKYCSSRSKRLPNFWELLRCLF
jgi:hypothetical protein